MRVLGDMGCSREIAEDAQRFQTTLLPPVGVVIEVLGTVDAPAGRFSIVVNQKKVMSNQVIGDISDHLANPVALRLRICAKIVVKRVEEVMTIKLIAAGVGFPEPFAVGALGPARLVGLPQPISLLLFPVTCQPAGIWVRPIAGPNGARNIALRGE